MDNSFRVSRGLSLNPLTSPTNSVPGDIYYDSAADTFEFFNNGFWINLASRVDVASAMSLTSAEFTAAVVQNSLIRVTGSALSNLYGLTASTAGKSVVVYNESTLPLIINSDSATEPTPANRILTPNGTNITVQADQVVQLVYDDSQQRWIIMSSPGTGSGTGFINYITNPDAEADTLDWNLYQNTAANIPSNGTGGTPTGLTFVRTTTNPLIGLGSFLLTQANSTDVQGGGVSTNFTIDSAYQANILNVSFNYNASSTFVISDGITAPLNDGTTSTNSGNSDVEVFIYDVTNGHLIPVTPEVIVANGSNNFSFAGYFQTSTNSVDYRLILHCATANANATGWQLKFDNVMVGPASLGIGNTSITPTQTIFTSGSGSYSPPSGCSRIRIRMIGGGAGGNGGGNIPISGNLGTDGGSTTFGVWTVGGGLFNGGNQGTNPGSGGAPIGSIVGASGFSDQGCTASPGGAYNSATNTNAGGIGGGGLFGFGGGISAYNGAGSAGSVPGAGGGGGGSLGSSASGGSGGGGGGYAELIVSPVASSYAYSVGNGGTGGAAGSSGWTAGGGAGGIIIIDEFYVGNGSQSNISKPPTVQILTSGSGTYVLPTPAPLYIEIEMVGGGGGGGGAVNTGGSPGAAGSATSFGSSLLTAAGGGGGQANTGGLPSVGSATVNSPAIVLFAAEGTQGNGPPAGGGFLAGTAGGAGPFGGAGAGGNGDALSSGNVNGGSGVPNTGAGGGGSGSNSVGNGAGGGGSSGAYIKALIYSPSPSYSYTVGAGGGGAGSSPYAGGSGAAGIIIVREYYAGTGPNPRFNQLDQGQMTVFESSGTFTAPFLSSLSTIYKYRIIAGGGGGGGTSVASASAGGGGSAAYSEGTFTGLIPGSSLAITIGGAGSGGSTGGGNGGTGGTSSIIGGSINVTVTGGGGGTGSTTTTQTGISPGGPGSVSSVSGVITSIATDGGYGVIGIQNVSGFGMGGAGAGSPFGAGGSGGGSNVSGPGFTSNNFGSGGGGSTGVTAGGGNGGQGLVIIEQLTP